MPEVRSPSAAIDRLFLAPAYVATAVSALMALVPFLFVEGAFALIAEPVAASLGSTKPLAELANDLGTAAYAFGALLGGDLVRRFAQRRLFLVVQAIAVAGWCLLPVSSSIWIFAAAQIVVGLTGGALLVIALPPLLQDFPARRIPTSAFAVNFGLFGAVAAGPLIGGLVASSGDEAWRWFLALFGASGTVAWLLAARHMPGGPPKDPERSLDVKAPILTALGTLLSFTAVGLMPIFGLLSPLVLALLVLGLGFLAVLVVVEFRGSEPLAPIRKALNTYTLMGLVIATIGGGVFVTATSILVTLRRPAADGVLDLGLSFWPQLLGVTIAAILFGMVIRTRLLFPLVLAGIAAIIAGPLILLNGGLHGEAAFALAVFVLGFGAGATVSPGLLFSAVSMPVGLLAGVIAIIELARAIGNFLAAPILIDAARIRHASASLGTDGAVLALEILLAITATGAAIALILFLTGRIAWPKARFEPWIEDGKPALDSPRLFEALRQGR